MFNICNAAFAELKKSGDALIINISATLHYGATWYQVHASAAKAAIDRSACAHAQVESVLQNPAHCPNPLVFRAHSITRSLGLEWGEYGIRVVGIAPGPIAGPFPAVFV